MNNYFAVGYKWTIADATRYGHTVVTSTSQADAEAKFQRQQKHITVMPLEKWNEERSKILNLAAAERAV